MKLGVQSNELSHFTFLGRWQIKMEAEQGNIDQAIEDSFTFLRSAFHWQQNKCLSDELHGLYFNSIGNEFLSMILYKNELSLSRFENIQKRLTDIYESHPLEIDFKFEKIEFMDMVQHVFTKGGLGGGHILPKYMPPLVQYSSIIITMSELRTEPTIKERLKYLSMSLLHTR